MMRIIIIFYVLGILAEVRVALASSFLTLLARISLEICFSSCDSLICLKNDLSIPSPSFCVPSPFYAQLCFTTNYSSRWQQEANE